jgi:hypothetical protein
VTYTNFRAFVAERERRGELRCEDHQLAAEQFIAALVGHLQLKIVLGAGKQPSAAEQRRRVASAVRTFMARYAT